jgi:hypothetical protein
MKNLLLSTIFISIQIFSFATSSKNSLSDKSFMIGLWQGEGWINMGTGNINMYVSQKIKYALDKQLIIEEGVGFSIDTLKKDTTVVYNPFSIYYVDSISKKTKIWSYTEDNMVYETIVFDSIKKKLEMIFKDNNGYIKIIDDFSSENLWLETGLISQDGKNWTTFLELKMTKSSKISFIPPKTSKLDTSMAKVSYMLGNWWGNGSIYKDSKKNNITTIEQIETKNIGNIFKIESKSLELIKDTAAKSVQNKSVDNYYGVLYYNLSTKKYELKSFNINGKISLSNVTASKSKIITWNKEENANQYIYESDYSTSLRKDKVSFKAKNSEKAIIYIENVLKNSKPSLDKKNISNKVQIFGK